MIISGKLEDFLGHQRVDSRDPLSPILFVLVIDVPSRLMERAKRFNLVEGKHCWNLSTPIYK